MPLLQTETSAVAKVVENESVTNLPLIDRRASQLQRLNGFVVQTNSGANASFAIAGGRSDNANYLIDGGTAQNLLLGVPILSFDPPAESVQEFSVAISNYAAELGRSGGAVIQMTTKSGTNSFHGSAYEYFRNTVLQEQPEFATTVPALHYNLFGASLGGPIKKDRTQFFFNYEGRRQIIGTPESLTVPTAQELTGNFNGIIDPKTGLQVVVNNPVTGQPYAPTIRSQCSIQWAPNWPPFIRKSAGSSPTAQFVVNDRASTVVDQYVARIDHVIGANDRVFGRFLADTDHTLTASVFPAAGVDPLGGLVHDYNYNASATWFHNFSANKINEFRVTYTRRQYLQYEGGVNTTLDSQIGLNTFNTSFFPTVNVAGLVGFGQGSQKTRRPQQSAIPMWITFPGCAERTSSSSGWKCALRTWTRRSRSRQVGTSLSITTAPARIRLRARSQTCCWGMYIRLRSTHSRRSIPLLIRIRRSPRTTGR